jgi:hypothetical protein
MKTTFHLRTLLAILMVLPQPLVPATITVNGQTGGPPGTCDLVEAIENANNDADTNVDCIGVGAYGDDVIELTTDVTLDTVNNTLNGPNGLPQVVSTIEIQGNDFTVRRITGAPDFRIFNIAINTGDLTLLNTTVSGGNAPGYRGGGIYNRGTITLTGSTLTGNSATYGGGLGNNASGFVTQTLTHSTLSGNSATRFQQPGGGYTGAVGGGIHNGRGTITLSHSTLVGNSADSQGGGIFNTGDSSYINLFESTLAENSAGSSGGGILNTFRSTATFTNSTVAGNSATNGGGIGNVGNATVSLTNSTLSGNSAYVLGGGIANFDGTATLISSTITENSDNYGGYYGDSGAGVRNDPGSTMSIASSILSNGPDKNCFGTITDNGNNLADDATCGTVSNTLTDLDPTLADNGGPTMTHALLPGSTAIDNAGACGTATDQRGAGREGNCDSGAFEFLTCRVANLVLSAATVTGIETRTNCQNIIVGPSFNVAATGDLTLRAGKTVEIGNGTTVEGVLTLAHDGDLQIGNTVFTTSTFYFGNLGGPAGADAKCSARAAAAGLSGSFKAWLSSVNPNGQPAQTFTQSNAPYVRVGGVRIADDWVDLTDGSLQAPISVDEFGNPARTANSWTATLTDCTQNSSVRDCLSWTSDNGSFTGWLGLPTQTGPTWTESVANAPCDSPQTLYCFEQ